MRAQPESSIRVGRLRWCGIALVAALVAGTGIAGMQPRVVGRFHDDGLYLATARSLATGEGYRHASLPTTPRQTKYPPLYSALMAGIWKVAPEHPANIFWFKASSSFFLACAVVLAGALGIRLLGGLVPPIVFALLVGLSPLALPFSDYPLTELLFLALCMGAFALGARAAASEGSSLGNALALGVVCGLAFLVRQAAVPLVAAATVTLAIGRRWRALGVFAIAFGALSLPWIWFKAVHAVPAANPLLTYYTGYEPSALQLGLADPALAIRILLGNVYYLWITLQIGSYLTFAPEVGVVLVAFLLLGFWRLFRRPLEFLPLFAILYAGLILLWPWHPIRYALPLMPLIPLALLSGCRYLEGRLGAARRPGRQRAERLALRALSWAPAALAVAMAIAWTVTWVPHRPGTTRAAILARLEYDWSGFEETAGWLRDHAPADAVLATAYDPLYYLSTGRRGVRPWFHKPWTYFYPPDGATADIGRAADVQAALDDLGADYLVVDPLDGYWEEEAAAELFREVLDRYAPPAYETDATLRFVSSDSLHRVYELPERRR